MQSNFFDRIRLPFRKEKGLYVSLYRIIGFYPRNIDLYKTALLHKSIARRNEKGKPVNNERLEFLGDAILDAVVGHIVFEHFPGKREGFLTNTRSKLVQRETLGKLAQEMGISELVLASNRGQSHNSYLGGNAFEALVGAIYLDRGYDACMQFMQKRILKQMINIDKVAYKEVNFKSKLLEWTQKNRVRMEFRLLSQQKDKQGSPVFNYQVVLEGIEGCSATGYSKKESQQIASKLTLEQLRKKPQFIDAVFAAKSDRTKMEEEPAMAVPRTDEQEDFIKTTEPQAQAKSEKRTQPKPEKKAEPKVEKKAEPKPEKKAEPKSEPKPEKKAEVKSEKKEKAEVKAPAERRKKAASKDKDQKDKDQKPRDKGQRAKDKDLKPSNAPQESAADNGDDEFDLSDITAREQSREEIIAAAEAAAFAEGAA